MINQADFASRMAELDAKKAEISKQAAEELKLLQQSTDMDLDVRWGMFLQLCPYLPTKSYYSHALDAFGGNFSLYDDLYVERYETISWPNFTDRVEEMRGIDSPSWATQENWDKVREAAIAEGYGGFANDW